MLIYPANLSGFYLPGIAQSADAESIGESGEEKLPPLSGDGVLSSLSVALTSLTPDHTAGSL